MTNIGYIPKMWRTSLASGESVGPLKIGSLRSNPKKTIAIVSGCYSPILANWSPLNCRCTRIDFCVDVMLDKKAENLPSFFHKEKKKLELRKGVASTAKFFDGKLGGFTMYNGSGGSSKLLRIYDKGVEQSGRSGLWLRYELQVGRDYASSAREGWLSSPDCTEHCYNVVSSYCKINGVYFPFINGKDKRLIKISKVKLETGEKERALRFMSSTVAPFVKRFRTIFGDDRTIKELGLPHLKG